ncbi:GDP-mannose 4,6-dehydratase [Cohnella terricola]|uniref:NAD-dependent epimerase/dehydratase family protein n=1 Tax=Cohnella terricola TaxID=1289167 RepID=A0A559JML9_9BACL|nr:GDP-mannose 4,6-dehydratase [Cohnella terricola]TVY01123.1 NAD-dependent epimerase/dehydratase family protein [Cohnella terricola]
MRILITGANGFVGQHVVAELANRGHEVYACMRNKAGAFQTPVKNLIFDLSDRSMLFDVIERSRPEGIIHLAAQSIVKEAWHDPITTLHINTEYTLALIEAAIRFVPRAKVITVGSGEEYGLTGKLGEPLSEEHACQPQNPYATSKLAAGQLAMQVAHREQLNVIHVRPFNHFGPGQSEGFVISDFASQIARIENEKSSSVIRVGDLSARRDFTDVRDVVDAYVRLMEAEVSSGVYNVCSGIPVTIREVLDFFISHSKIPVEIQTDPSRLRKSEVPLFVGASHKLNRATGWKPTRKFEDSLFETLEWWRRKI